MHKPLDITGERSGFLVAMNLELNMKLCGGGLQEGGQNISFYSRKIVDTGREARDEK